MVVEVYKLPITNISYTPANAEARPSTTAKGVSAGHHWKPDRSLQRTIADCPIHGSSVKKG